MEFPPVRAGFFRWEHARQPSRHVDGRSTHKAITINEEQTGPVRKPIESLSSVSPAGKPDISVAREPQRSAQRRAGCQQIMPLKVDSRLSPVNLSQRPENSRTRMWITSKEEERSMWSDQCPRPACFSRDFILDTSAVSCYPRSC